MKKENLFVLSGVGVIGYVVFHDHKTEESQKNCWLCGYRGLIFLGSCVTLGGYLAVTE